MRIKAAGCENMDVLCSAAFKAKVCPWIGESGIFLCGPQLISPICVTLNLCVLELLRGKS